MCIDQQEKRRNHIKKKLQQHKPMRGCLSCSEQPKLAYKKGVYDEYSPVLPYPIKLGTNYEAFIFYCPSCNYRVGPFMDLQPAITAWHTSNTENSPQHLALWQEQYNQLVAVVNDPSVEI